VPINAGTREEPRGSPEKPLDAVISSKLRLVVLRRDLERFNCEAAKDEPSLEGCRQMDAQARLFADELEELKERAGSAWTHEKQTVAEASAFRASRTRPKPYTYRWRTNPATTYRTL
jgi:hypothetical protein